MRLPKLSNYGRLPSKARGGLHFLLAQYAGRIHRESDGKERVTIYDYVDCSLPMLQCMFNKREKSYKAMGYQISFSEEVSEDNQLSTTLLLASDKSGSEAPP